MMRVEQHQIGQGCRDKLNEVSGFPAFTYTLHDSLFDLPARANLTLPQMADSAIVHKSRFGRDPFSAYWHMVQQFSGTHNLRGLMGGQCLTGSDPSAWLSFPAETLEDFEKIKGLEKIASQFHTLMQDIILVSDPVDVLSVLLKARDTNLTRAESFLFVKDQATAMKLRDKPRSERAIALGETPEDRADRSSMLYLQQHARKNQLPNTRDLVDALVLTEQTEKPGTKKQTEATGHLDNLSKLIPALTSYIGEQRATAPDIRAGETPLYGNTAGQATSPEA